MPDADPAGLLASGFGSRRMADVVSLQARVAHMLTFETALAGALADVGLLPTQAAEAVAAACDADTFDVEAYTRLAPHASTPVTALLQVVRDEADDPTADALHRGATSQDVLDTAMAMALRDAQSLLADELGAMGDRLAALADEHRSTLTAGRTLGQHAVPITHGLRFARWLGALDRHRDRLEQLHEDVVLQLGGAAGTLASWGDRGLQVADALAARLDLPVPDLPWHAERDRIATLAGQLAALMSTVTTIAAELVRLASTEVAELVPADGGGSSAMPHKANPTDAVAARAAARLATAELTELAAGTPVEYERAAGGWQAEWVMLPSVLVRAAGALERLHQALDGVTVDVQRCNDNLARGNWLVLSEPLMLALLPHVGRATAADITGDLAAQARAAGVALQDVATADERVTAHLDPGELDAALDPAASLPVVHQLIDRAIDTHRPAHAEGP